MEPAASEHSQSYVDRKTASQRRHLAIWAAEGDGSQLFRPAGGASQKQDSKWRSMSLPLARHATFRIKPQKFQAKNSRLFELSIRDSNS